jgi:hypothetical protein
MRRIVWILAIGASGCGSQPTRPDVDLSGRWTFVGYFSNFETTVSCDGGGTAEIFQGGSTFHGGVAQTRTCRGPAGAATDTNAQPITEGHVEGTSVRFQIETCSYTGTLSGSDQISGFTTCTLTILGRSYPFEGQWHAGRR